MGECSDKDIRAIELCCKALNRSTSRRMLAANMRFLWDRYIEHPSELLPKKLQRGQP